MTTISGLKKDLSSTALNIQNNPWHQCVVRLWCYIADDMQRSNHSVHLKLMIALQCWRSSLRCIVLSCVCFLFSSSHWRCIVFLERSFLQEECRCALFQLPHSITPTHLTFLSPDKYLCFTVAAMHSDMKCGILAQSMCLADIHENDEPRPLSAALNLMSGHFSVSRVGRWD